MQIFIDFFCLYAYFFVNLRHKLFSMRKIWSFLVLLICAQTAGSVERVSLDQLQADWSRYADKMVEVTTPLVVCGSFYDSLILAPQRLFCPEERAEGLAKGDSSAYWRIVEQNRETSICVHCRNNYYEVRTGDVVKGFKARVTGTRHLVSGQGVKTHHRAMPRLPKADKGVLRIVGANIENYFADLGGYATRKTTPAQQAVKTRKLTAALKTMKADVYAFCEMQVGDKAPLMLLAELNKSGDKYAFAAMPMENMDRIGGCIVYNKERVRVYNRPISAYTDSLNHYYARMFAIGLEEIVSGEKMILSLNHFKSKRPGRGNYDTHLKRMQNVDSLLAMLPQAMELFGDPDILLLGDYNCYTQEQPIQAIVQAGYEDLLPLGGEGDYSYSFKGEAGYLDRCFATPAMAGQVLRVMPWHVNADWYYSHGAYKMKDKSLHRYADHDPIVVDVKLR